MTEFKPEENDLDAVRQKVQEGIDRAREFFPKEKEVKVGLGWTESDFAKEEMGGASGMAYSATYFEVDFNSEVEDWEKSVIGTAIHEFAHTYLYEKIDFDHSQDMPLWLHILEEALTQNTTEKLAPEKSSPWRKKHSRGEIAEYWPKIKEEELGRNYSYPDPLFINKSEGGYPNWLGYSMAYLIGQELLKEHELEEFPELKKEDVIEAGNKLFG